jgi:hypothetical protein
MLISSDRRSGDKDKDLKLNNWSLCFQNVNVILFQTKKIEITDKLYVRSVSTLSDITYLLTPWSRVHLEKLTGPILSPKNPNTCNELR